MIKINIIIFLCYVEFILLLSLLYHYVINNDEKMYCMCITTVVFIISNKYMEKWRRGELWLRPYSNNIKNRSLCDCTLKVLLY